MTVHCCTGKVYVVIHLPELKEIQKEDTCNTIYKLCVPNIHFVRISEIWLLVLEDDMEAKFNLGEEF
jgi:hypothetical protein